MVRFSLNDAHVLLTGASNGIGAALARELAGRGARLTLAARRADKLHALSNALAASGAPRPCVLPADLSQRGAALSLALEAVAASGPVHVLVNNAGAGLGGAQWIGGDSDVARALFELNYWSPLALIQALVPAMMAQKRGAVVNVTSLAQVSPFALTGHYAASKAALALCDTALGMELRNSGVHVLEIAPGPTDTQLLTEANELSGAQAVQRWIGTGNAEELAKLAVIALEKRRRRLVYPRRLTPSLWLPKLAQRATQFMQRNADISDTRLIASGPPAGRDEPGAQPEVAAPHS